MLPDRVSNPGPRDLRVRCPTDCAMRSGSFHYEQTPLCKMQCSQSFNGLIWYVTTGNKKQHIELFLFQLCLCFFILIHKIILKYQLYLFSKYTVSHVLEIWPIKHLKISKYLSLITNKQFGSNTSFIIWSLW